MLTKLGEAEVILAVLGVKGSYEELVQHGACTFKKMFEAILGTQHGRSAGLI